ncbi:hypothetical protein N9M16_08580, partial [Candidatus Dependentiae bacterium]|nr:hypothetical protein [Candidatus Dependentiae bacterium]
MARRIGRSIEIKFGRRETKSLAKALVPQPNGRSLDPAKGPFKIPRRIPRKFESADLPFRTL